MCGKGGGSPPVPSGSSTAFQSTVSPAAFSTPLYQDFLNRANTLSNTPFNPAMQGSVAALTPEQTFAGGQVYSKGLELGNFDPNQVAAIQSPFTQQVVNATQNWFNNQNAIQANDLLSQGIRSGNAFGGDRAGVAEGVLAGQQQLAQAPVIAGLYQSGYGQALQEYNQLKQMGMQGAQAALGWGSLEQAQKQRELDVAQQNAMMESAYPFQTLNWYGAILGGIAPLLGSQAVGYNTPPTPGGAGFRRGGLVLDRRAQGGLVPVLIRHNGGLVAGLAYGGSSDSDDDEDKERARESRDVSTSGATQEQPDLPEHERSSSWGKEIGQLQASRQQMPAPQFPSGGSQQPQSTASTIGQWADTAGKVFSVGSKILPALALLERGGAVHGYYDGGEILSDESEYPIEPGQQYARDYAGRTTWFNPRNEVGGYTYRDESGQDWADTGARSLREGPHASGLPSTTRGFATPGGSDLGNWFKISLPGRNDPVYAQKTDIGPPGVVDLNAPLASSAGYRPGTVPSGLTYVQDLGRERPPEADGVKWPDPGKGNVIPEGGLPTGEAPATPQRVPGERMGRAPTPQGVGGPEGAGARPDGMGMGPVGGRIPGAPGVLGGITDTAKEALRNPLLQFAGAYLSGTSPWGRVNLGNALLKTAGIQEAQRAQDRKELLDQKPDLIHTSQGLAYKYPDGSIVPTGLKSEAQGQREAELKRQAAELKSVDTEKPGAFGTTQRGKGYYSIDEEGNRTWVDLPTQQPAPQPQQAPAPAEPAAPATGVGNAPVRQTEAEPASGGGSAAAGPAAPAGGQAAAAPAPQIAQGGPALSPPENADPKLWGPVAQAWQTGAVKPAGTVTNQVARNDAALDALTPAEQRVVKDMVDYKLDPNKHFPGVKNAETKRAAIDAAKQYDPSYDAASFANKQAARKVFEATGVEARNFQSNDMAFQHLGRAMDNVEALNNIGGRWGTETVNEARRTLKTKVPGFRDPEYAARVKQMETDLSAVSTELAKSFRGAGSLAQREIMDWQAKVKVASGPEELRSVLKEGAVLLYGRLDANASRYNDVMGPQYARPAESWLSPKGQETLKRALAIDPQKPIPPAGQAAQPQQPGGPAGGGQQAPVQVQSIDEARKLPPGTQFIIPDGSGRIGTVPQPRQ